MFTASADLYDTIYFSFKNYPDEARQIAELIRDERPNARSVLDVACGTGEHARLLTEQHGFNVDGIDVDPAFVAIARDKLKAAAVHQGDMTSFDLRKKYDVVLCLFSSIAYLRTLENVTRALACFRRHVTDGGLVLVEPWFPPGRLDPARVSMNTVERDDLRVCRMSRINVEERLSTIHFHYLIGRAGAIEYAEETHELGLFTTDEMLRCFRDAGLLVEHRSGGPAGRGLYLARPR